MRFLALGLVSLVLVGCSAQEETKKDKREIVCLDIIKSVVTDPAGLKVNSVNVRDGALDSDELKRYFDERYPAGLTEIGKQLLALRTEEIASSKDTFVEVDYTANERLGPVRDRALCRYFTWRSGDTELVSFTFRNRDYGQSKFTDLFIRYGQPKNLSLTNAVK